MGGQSTGFPRMCDLKTMSFFSDFHFQSSLPCFVDNVTSKVNHDFAVCISSLFFSVSCKFKHSLKKRVIMPVCLK